MNIISSHNAGSINYFLSKVKYICAEREAQHYGNYSVHIARLTAPLSDVIIDYGLYARDKRSMVHKLNLQVD